MEHGAAYLHIGPLNIPSTWVTMLAICIGLIIFAKIATRNLLTRPQGIQNVAEKMIEMLQNFIGGIAGYTLMRKYFYFLATLFIFILISNYSGLLPLSGMLPGLAAPTSNLSMIAGLALCTFVMTHVAGVQGHGGLGYIKHFFQPVAFIFPLLILDELVRPVSLSLRLFGNIMGEETVAHQMAAMLPVLAPVVMQVLSVLMGFVQAMVFTLLASVYLSSAHGEEHHLEPHAAQGAVLSKEN